MFKVKSLIKRIPTRYSFCNHRNMQKNIETLMSNLPSLCTEAMKPSLTKKGVDLIGPMLVKHKKA